MLAKPLDVLFPPVCLHCRTRIYEQDMWLCGDCTDKLSYLPELHCPVCGYPEVDAECWNCAENHYVFTQALSVFLYEGAAKTLVHELKYTGFTGIGKWFANELYKLALQARQFTQVDYITAIPLHRVRKRERGFNQSELIGRALAKQLNLVYTDELIKRKSNTVSQTLLDAGKRKSNLSQAFGIGKLSPIDKDILLIDDVFTTGTTVNEAARLLRSAGANKIYSLTVCHGL